MADKKVEEVVDRKFNIEFYLKESESKLSANIQKMMKSLYKGKYHTLDEWAAIDKELNGRRC